MSRVLSLDDGMSNASCSTSVLSAGPARSFRNFDLRLCKAGDDVHGCVYRRAYSHTFDKDASSGRYKA